MIFQIQFQIYDLSKLVQQTDEAIQFYSQKFKKLNKLKTKMQFCYRCFLKQFEIGNNKQDKT